ncbi:MAG: Lrp/AsnC family transcriptional regulator [Proteobacteria bacterium]|nr:Lrp/AsnC family transcriptional regulator [Pseudomonadota bacterium]
MKVEQNNLDEIDLAILKMLQQDVTITNAELSKRVGLSPSAALGRTKRLKESGIIRQQIAIIDEDKIGLEMSAFVFVSLSPHDRKTTRLFLKSIHDIPQIMECYNISGKFDFLLKIVAPGIKDYREFIINNLIEVPGVGKVETQVVLSKEKLIFSLPLEKSNQFKTSSC